MTAFTKGELERKLKKELVAIVLRYQVDVDDLLKFNERKNERLKKASDDLAAMVANKNETIDSLGDSLARANASNITLEAAVALKDSQLQAKDPRRHLIAKHNRSMRKITRDTTYWGFLNRLRFLFGGGSFFMKWHQRAANAAQHHDAPKGL